MTTRLWSDRLDRIEEKLDLIVGMLKDTNGAKGFGMNLLANVIGNMVDGK